MSLLLDALKRAEQEKMARHGGEGAAEEPAAAAPAPRRKLELELHEHPAPAPAGNAPSAEPAAGKAVREGAKAMFAAKQPEVAAAGAPTANRKAVIAVVAVAVVVAAAGGGYVWYEVNKAPATVARGPLPTTSPRPVTPAKVEPPPAEAVPPVALPKAEGPATPERTKPEPKAAEKLVMNLLNDSPSAKPAPPLKLSRTIEEPRIPQQVSAGYEALVRGDSVTARRQYEAAVAADPASLDAHLGLATAAARTGDRDTARKHYRRALALDPKNPSASAGLAALADFTRPAGLEERLRADIAAHPQSAALHFTLGNLYASQSRWNEAQAAYFEAYRYDPESADLAYNLAVSLDHLGQPRLAAEFYQRALAASQARAAQFDKGQVSRRIAELKP